MNTWNLHRLRGHFKRAQQEVCHPLHLFTELFNVTNIGACSQALEVQQELPAPTDGDGGQSNT